MACRGEIRMFAGDFAPKDWLFCDGQLLPVMLNQGLFDLLGYSFGGSGDYFALPDLRGRVPVGGLWGSVGASGGQTKVTLTTDDMPSHGHGLRAAAAAGDRASPAGATWAPAGQRQLHDTAPDGALAPAVIGTGGGNEPHDNMMPYACLNFIICVVGDMPEGVHGWGTKTQVAGFVGEIRIFPYSEVPAGWWAWPGTELSITNYTALYGLIGNTYGGRFPHTFALPDLDGRVPLHRGGPYALGQYGGEQTHAVTWQEMPEHHHQLYASSSEADQTSPAGHVWAVQSTNPYAATETVNVSADMIAPVGASRPHENMQPYLTLLICICLEGVYPGMDHS